MCFSFQMEAAEIKEKYNLTVATPHTIRWDAMYPCMAVPVGVKGGGVALHLDY